MIFKKLFLFVVLPLIFISCDKDVGEEIMYSPDLKMPVVTGLIFTGEASPEVLGYWGNPSGTNFCHPTIGVSTNIWFSNPYETNVKVWVVPARLPQQKSSDVLQRLSGFFISASGQSVAVLMNEVKQAGIYAIEYHFKDSNGNILPEGFYRIYIEIGDWLRWCDVLHFRNESNYYKSLVSQIQNQTTYIWRY